VLCITGYITHVNDRRIIFIRLDTKNCYSLILFLFNMKFTSFCLNLLLAVPFFRSALTAIQWYNDYDLFKGSGLVDSGDSRWDWPLIVLALIYLIAFKVSLFLNIKKRYRTSAFVSGGAAIVYLFLLIFKFV
jgi:hypothetical protein